LYYIGGVANTRQEENTRTETLFPEVINKCKVFFTGKVSTTHTHLRVSRPRRFPLHLTNIYTTIRESVLHIFSFLTRHRRCSQLLRLENMLLFPMYSVIGINHVIHKTRSEKKTCHYGDMPAAACTKQ